MRIIFVVSALIVAGMMIFLDSTVWAAVVTEEKAGVFTVETEGLGAKTVGVKTCDTENEQVAQLTARKKKLEADITYLQTYARLLHKARDRVENLLTNLQVKMNEQLAR